MPDQPLIVEIPKAPAHVEAEASSKAVVIPEGWPNGTWNKIQKSLKDPNRQRGVVFENEKQRNAMAIRKGLSKPGKISYDTLRRIAMSVYVARICINSLKTKITKTPWVVKPIDQTKTKGQTNDKRVEHLNEFFRHPNPTDSFRTLLDKMCEDLLVLDAVSLEKTRYPDGTLAELYFVDSATIRPVFDDHGNQDIEIPLNTADGQELLPVSYLQILNNSQYGGPESGDIIAAWPKKDFIHFHMHPQGSMEGFGYGLSPLEGVLSVVSNLMNSDNFNSTYFEEGAFPPVILNIVGAMNPRDMEAFKEYFYQEIEGNFHRPAIMASQQKSEVINLKDFTNRDMQFMEYTTWLAKMLCAAYGMSPEDIGITDTTGSKSVSDVQKTISEEKGYGSILDLFREQFNQIIWNDFGYDDLEFDWAGQDDIAPDVASTIQDTSLKNGSLTLNEVRLKNGESPYGEWADKPMILTAEGYKPVMAQDPEQEEGGDEADDKEKVIAGEKPYKDQGTEDIDSKKLEKSQKTLYVYRPVKNAKDIIEWAKAQGFKTTVQPKDMHVTIAFSKAMVEWDNIQILKDNIYIDSGHRTVMPLGDKAAVVLSFDSELLSKRWQDILASGASWDYEGFTPHITISYKTDGVDLESIEAYDGPIILGPEVRNIVNEDWQDTITEKMKKAILTPSGFKTWADDRGTSQPFICMDIKSGYGTVIKPPVAINLESQDLEISLTTNLVALGLNVMPVTKMTYVEVRNMLRERPDILIEFDNYCEMTPEYDSEKWRSKYGGSRKFSYYLVSEYIDGYCLNNPLLLADMKRDPASYYGVIEDLVGLWKAERDMVLGDRRADQYIISHNKRAYGFDYQFSNDAKRWERSKDSIAEALLAVPELHKMFTDGINKVEFSFKAFFNNLVNKK